MKFQKLTRKISLFFTFILALSLSFLIPAAKVNATTYPATYSSANSFYFEDFTAEYYLYRAEDGRSKMLVVETLTAIFPNTDQNHGITRVIPFTNNDGKNLTMNTGDTIYIDVERNGEEEPVSKVEVGDGYYNIYIGDADKYVHGEQVYTLTYEFEDVMLDFDTWQELYWDANGNDWSQRFNSVSAYVYLDPEIADKFTGETSCYVGKYGSSGQSRCKTEQSTEEIEIEGQKQKVHVVGFTANRLSARETLTFDLKFDANTFAPAPAHYSYRYLIMFIGAIIATIIMIILIILCWKSTAAKRKYYKNLFIKPEYTPAKDFTVAEMAQNYIGKGANGDKRVATLIDMAVNHKIDLIKTEKDGAFGKKKNIWKIRIKTDTMNKQQATILKILAGSSTPLRIDQEIKIQSHTATSELTGLVSKFNDNIESSLKKKGLLVEKSKGKSKKDAQNYSGILSVGIAICVIATVICILIFDGSIPSYLTPIGGENLPIYTIILMLVTVVASFFTVAKTNRFSSHTEKGLEYSRYMDGLKMYMEMAEADRLKMLQSVKGADTTHEGVVRLYEKLLPYAILFKLEESWLKELARYYEFDDVAQPTWYIGVGVFSARDFSAAMIAASHSVTSTIAHSTTTSSSSGASGFGGGFSGGGGGGGGGGGW